MGTGQRTRSILLATEFSTSVDRLTWLTPSPRLTGFNRSLSTTQWLTFTVAVTMPFSLQYPFNFNVEISVSSGNCRYQDLAGFLPRVLKIAPGSPAIFLMGTPNTCGSTTISQAGLSKGRIIWRNDMEMIAVRSGAMTAVGYDSSTRKMSIRFQQGHSYDFCNVPSSVHQGLMSAGSKGTYYNQYIRDRYRC
ncbi:KTSC domain-containing protein [Pseudomonas ogarae]|uniref:KTSC domain-containing protein n=1 Tax=Pseudomonas ogarae (strain DSM 112162 / CECT 30235 / F113) TaxID=1114970 RepID=UPI002E0F1D1D